jgi:hypothetical protein
MIVKSSLLGSKRHVVATIYTDRPALEACARSFAVGAPGTLVQFVLGEHSGAYRVDGGMLLRFTFDGDVMELAEPVADVDVAFDRRTMANNRSRQFDSGAHGL